MKSTIIFQTKEHDTVRSLEVTEAKHSSDKEDLSKKSFHVIHDSKEMLLAIPTEKLTSVTPSVWFLGEDPFAYGTVTRQKEDVADLEKEGLLLQAITEIPKISTVWKETATVHLDQRLTTRTEEVSCDLAAEEVVIDRRTVERVLEEGESVETKVMPDGSLLIPVIQERLVVKKIRVLSEEVLVKKQSGSVPFSSSVELRSIELEVTKTPSA